MGVTASKKRFAKEVSILKDQQTYSNNVLKLKTKECEELKCSLQEQRLQFERKHDALKRQYSELEQNFVNLKSEMESDGLNLGAPSNYTNVLESKLQAALSDCASFPNGTRDKTEFDALKSYYEKLEERIKEDVKIKISLINSQHQQELEEFREIQRTLTQENSEKEKDLERFKQEVEDLKERFNVEKQELIKQGDKKRLLLCESYEKEKQDLHSLWEAKLNEKLIEYNNRINSMKDQHANEKRALIENSKDLENLTRKCQLLTKLFEEIRTRYDRRESRKEDLEKIAELEGELIIQAEELERQKYLIKQLKRKSDFRGYVAYKNFKKKPIESQPGLSGCGDEI